MKDCVFCKIVGGDIPANILYEDDHCLAILDAFPAQEGHSLIIPKAHHENLLELPTDLAKQIMAASQKIAAAIIKALEVQSFNVLQNNGHQAGQEVMHYHMHLIPRYPGRGNRGSAEALHPSGYEYKPSKADLEQIAERIKTQI